MNRSPIKTRFLLIMLLLLFSLRTNCQVSDVELWAGPIFRYSFLRIFRAEIEQQVRWNENISAYNLTFTEAGLRAKIIDGLYFKAKYRYSFMNNAPEEDPDDEEYNEQRYMLDLSYGRKLFNSGLSADLRVRFQESHQDITKKRFTYLRNRLELSYKVSGWLDPFISVEMFYRFNDINQVRKYRYTVGTQFEVTRYLEINPFVHYQQDVNVKSAEDKIRLGLEAVVDIDKFF